MSIFVAAFGFLLSFWLLPMALGYTQLMCSDQTFRELYRSKGDSGAATMQLGEQLSAEPRGDFVDTNGGFYSGATIRISDDSWHPLDVTLAEWLNAKHTLEKLGNGKVDLVETRDGGRGASYHYPSYIDSSGRLNVQNGTWVLSPVHTGADGYSGASSDIALPNGMVPLVMAPLRPRRRWSVFDSMSTARADSATIVRLAHAARSRDGWLSAWHYLFGTIAPSRIRAQHSTLYSTVATSELTEARAE